MSYETVINFRDKLEMSPQHWSPRIAARVNDAHFELARVHGGVPIAPSPRDG